MEEHQQRDNTEKSAKKNLYRVAFITGLAIAVIFTFVPGIGRGSFFHGILGSYAAALALGIYIVGCIAGCFKSAHFFARVCIALAIVLALYFLSIFSGSIVLNYDIRNAKKFCEELVPLLDDYQKENGEYPGGLNVILPENTKPPIIVRSDDFYYDREGDSFSFSFSDPGGMMNGWIYSGRHKGWYEWD